MLLMYHSLGWGLAYRKHLTAVCLCECRLFVLVVAVFQQVSETAYRRDPVSKVSVLTLDMEKSIDFYQDVSIARLFLYYCHAV